MSNSEQIDIKKSLISLAIEKILLNVDKSKFEMILFHLNEMRIPPIDWEENPTILKNLLEKTYGNSYKTIIKDIEEELKKYSEQEMIIRFIQKLKN